MERIEVQCLQIRSHFKMLLALLAEKLHITVFMKKSYMEEAKGVPQSNDTLTAHPRYQEEEQNL